MLSNYATLNLELPSATFMSNGIFGTPEPSEFQKSGSDDELVARLLIVTWKVTTGRMLFREFCPGELTEEELIDFWAAD